MTAAKNEDCIGYYLKIAVWWGTNETFDIERFKSIKGDFLIGKMSKFLAVG